MFDKARNTYAVCGASNFDSTGDMDTAQVECESKTRQWMQGIKGTEAAKFKTMGEVLDGRGKHSLRAYTQIDPTWGVAEVDDTHTGRAERAAADAALPGLGELLPEARADIQLFGDVAEPDFKDSEKRVLGMCPGAPQQWGDSSTPPSRVGLHRSPSWTCPDKSCACARGCWSRVPGQRL
jgi:hypothetical protein